MPDASPQTRITSSILDRPDVQRVESLVAGVYDGLYGEEHWAHKTSLVRASIVQFVIDTARAGCPRALVHTDRTGTSHYIDPLEVLQALDPDESEG